MLKKKTRTSATIKKKDETLTSLYYTKNDITGITPCTTDLAAGGST